MLPENGERTMKCPNCGGREAVQIDMHSEGFSAETSPVKECGACGLVWRIKVIGERHELDIIKPVDKSKAP
jgi:uncharacterized Zn finger protein